MAAERLQKILAQAGVASRRHAEELISAGRVKVGGRTVTELGSRADPRRDRIELDGKRIVAEDLVYLVMHKPRSVMTTLSDPEGRPTVKDYLRDVVERVVPVGRLDFHTSGCLLLSNDGEFVSGLMHPRFSVPKLYVVKVAGEVDDAALERWRQSVVIEGRATEPAVVRRLRFEGGKTWLEVTLREGRNRQVRRLGEATGFPVMRLARIAYAGVTSEDLRPGQWRHLTHDELLELKQRFGVPRRVRSVTLPTRAAEPAHVRRARSESPACGRSDTEGRARSEPQGRARGGSGGGERGDVRGHARGEPQGRARAGSGGGERGKVRGRARGEPQGPARQEPGDSAGRGPRRSGLRGDRVGVVRRR